MEKADAADALLRAGQYQAALDSYLAVGGSSSSARALVRTNMLHALSKTLDCMCPHVISTNDEDPHAPAGVKWEGALSEISKRVYSLYGDDVVAMTLLGVKCLYEGLYEQANFFLSAAVLEDSECVLAKEKLRILYDCTVHRWHFHMLNDIQRNSAYSRAIRLALETVPHCAVLDIGSGTGILSMMGVRWGAERMYAVEVNGAMVAMSHDILAANGMSDNVTVLHRLSTSLSVPRDIPNRVNLVVTEIVDAGLLGEHIVPTLRHAWKELLLPPNAPQSAVAGDHMSGHVIPAGATVYAMAIECQEIRRKSRLLSCTVAGVNLESVRLEGSCKARPGGRGEPGGGMLEREVYSCERLKQIRGGTTSLTQAIPVLHFDFTHPQIPLPESRVSLEVTGGGRLDAIAVWFDLHLFADISISTSPSWDLSWEQAIFPVTVTRGRIGGEGAGGVEPGDVIRLHASCSDKSLFMDVEQVGTDGDHFPGSGVDEKIDEKPVFYVERSDLLRLNDSHFTSSYHKAISRAVTLVREEGEGGGEETSPDGTADCVLLDMCHGLSLFGLAAAKLGADFVQVAHCSPAYQSLVEHLAASNDVSDHVSFRHLDMRQCHAQLVWDVVVCDMVSPQGTLQEGILEKLAHIRATQLCPTSIMIPSRLSIEAVLVFSPALRAQCSVLGTVPTLGFKIAPFINQYQVSHFVDLDLSAYSLQLLSDHTQLMTVDLGSPASEPLKLSVEVPMKVSASGSVTGIAYWYTFGLFEDVTFSTAPASYQESHWHQCVFMLSEDMAVCERDVLTVRALLKDSCVDISLAPP